MNPYAYYIYDTLLDDLTGTNSAPLAMRKAEVMENHKARFVVLGTKNNVRLRPDTTHMIKEIKK